MATIAALASGVGRSGVAVLRISGPQARFVFETITGHEAAPRLARFARFRDKDGGAIDSGIALFFPGPGSFTGEDVTELQCHGSPAVIRRLLMAVVASHPDIRLAEAGEFTRRAFLNGKLDLTAVEALGMLIDSDTERQREAAQASLDGGLARRIDQWRDKVLLLLAEVEAGIDFSDEADVAASLRPDHQRALAALREDIAGMLAQARGSRRLRDGILVAIVGAPNAGKSSLLNALARRDAAIVSAVPGTTRDLIEVVIELDGWPLRLVDMAGLRDTSDPVEQEGVRRARAVVAHADIVLDLGGADPGPMAGHSIRIRSKSDLGGPGPDGEGVDISLSSLTGDGIDELRSRLVAVASDICAEGTLVVTERQEALLVRAGEALERASGFSGREELLAEDLRMALRSFEQVTGRQVAERVLDEIFARFCIGK